MAPAHLGVILDSSILIDAERQHLNPAHFLKHLAEKIGNRETALCSISVAELTMVFIAPIRFNGDSPAARSWTT